MHIYALTFTKVPTQYQRRRKKKRKQCKANYSSTDQGDSDRILASYTLMKEYFAENNFLNFFIYEWTNCLDAQMNSWQNASDSNFGGIRYEQQIHLNELAAWRILCHTKTLYSWLNEIEFMRSTACTLSLHYFVFELNEHTNIQTKIFNSIHHLAINSTLSSVIGCNTTHNKPMFQQTFRLFD